MGIKKVNDTGTTKLSEMLRLKFILILIIGFTGWCSLSAQVERSVNKKTISGKEYYLHSVTEGLTIYELAMLYRVDVDSIRSANTGLVDDLSALKTVKIPAVESRDDYIFYRVSDSRTNLKEVAKRFNVSVEEIRSINPRISDQVRYNDVIRIPLPAVAVMPGKTEPPVEAQKEKEQEKVSDCRDPINKTRIYNIALMLPLYLEQADTTNQFFYLNTDEADKYAPFRFLSFYQGLKLALDSMATMGFKARLSVYDVDQTAYKAERALAAPELKNADLIVGPFHLNTFPQVAEFARQHQIPIVNPLTQKTDIVEGNPFVFKVQPTDRSRMESIADVIRLNYPDYRIIITRFDDYRYVDETNELKSILEKKLAGNEAGRIGISVSVYKKDSIPGLIESASLVRPNLVVAITDNEAFAVSLLTALNDYKNQYSFLLMGAPDWENFNKLENQYLMQFRAHYMTGSFIDYADPFVTQFVLRFRELYKSEPSDYAYDGFDIGWYFSGALMLFGKDMIPCLEDYNPGLLQNRFIFKQVPGGGYENQYWNLYMFNGYQKEKLTDTWDKD